MKEARKNPNLDNKPHPNSLLQNERMGSHQELPSGKSHLSNQQQLKVDSLDSHCIMQRDTF